MTAITNVLSSKRVLFSTAVIVAVIAATIAATGAFFSDTETSSGNIFTAGAIDLKVDHLKQTYNGDDCQTCSITLWSADDNTDVVGYGGNTTIQSGFPFPAPQVDPHPGWASHGTAQWIWATNDGTGPYGTAIGDDGSNGVISYTFERKFQWWGSSVGVNFALSTGADNQYEVWLNGIPVKSDFSENNFSSLDSLSGPEAALFMANLQTGENTLTIKVTNVQHPGGPSHDNPTENPAGLLYYLNIERDQQDCQENTGYQSACQLWTEQDLDGSQTFFNFGDIKPADEGTNLISLHVYSNDAYICLLPTNVEDDENGVVDPELDAGDDSNDGIGEGELSGLIEFFGWNDDGDGEYQVGEEVLVSAGTSLQDIQSQMIALELAATDTGYVGLAWCAGDQTGPQNTNDAGPISCDGNGMSNIAQTDQVMADLVAYAEQQRNNDGFSCDDVNLNPQP